MPKKTTDIKATTNTEVAQNTKKASFTTNVIKLLKKPVVTEKSAMLGQNNNEYVFKVDLNADKANIKKVISDLYKVDVESVNTIVRKGKKVRFGKVSGKRSDEKIAIVKIKKDQTINILK